MHSLKIYLALKKKDFHSKHIPINYFPFLAFSQLAYLVAWFMFVNVTLLNLVHAAYPLFLQCCSYILRFQMSQIIESCCVWQK